LVTVGTTPVTLAGKINDQAVACGSFVLAPLSQGGAPPAPASAEGDAVLRGLDGEAQTWLTSAEGQAEKERLLAQLGNGVALLMHLPSGRAAAPAPASLSERDDYQIAVIIDRKTAQSWTVDVNVVTCSARDPFRIKGDFTDVAGLKFAKAREFAIMLVERPLGCGAERMEYGLSVTAGAAKGVEIKTGWKVRPVYHLAATVAWAFDGAQRRSFAPVDGKIAETRERFGPEFNLGFTWFPGGVEYGAMRWYQHVLNPFLLVDIDAPKENFVVGTAITPTGGISVGIGMSVHKDTLLKSGQVGDPFTGDGDVPVRKDWTKDSLGFYVGVLFDTNIFKAVNNVFGTSKKKE
jgi:hypothetical protein